MSTLLFYIIKYKYLILVPACVIEGPVVMMISGFLIKLGYLNLPLTFLTLTLGDLLGDTIWYYVGRHGGHKFIFHFGKYFNVTENDVSLITHIFHKYKNKILFISKITAGFGLSLATLITAGMIKIPFKRFIIINFLGELVWTSICVSVGYFFGKAYIQVSNLGGKVSLIVSVLFLCLCVLQLSKYARQRINKI